MKGAKKRRNRTAGVYGAIRFLGAFRRSPGFWEALEYETSLYCPEERASVALTDKALYLPSLRGIGVLFSARDVRRVFSDDCWSEKRTDGSLHPTRLHKGWTRQGFSSYEEAFLKRNATPVAIIVNPDMVSGVDMISLRAFANKAGLRLICESSTDLREKLVKKALRERRRL